MASTSEELSAQAEQMEATIQFFKVDGATGTGTKSASNRKGPSKPASVAAPVRVADAGAVRKDDGGTAGGIDLKMDDDDAVAEFVRY